MNNTNDKISTEYSKAITQQSNTVVAQTGMAKFADYTKEQLAHLPEDIIKHSFGCGNPVAFSEVKEGQTVLDLGCGAGLDLILASDKVGESGRVIGVDLNQDMLALASKRIADYPNIELRNGRIEDLPIESNSIDWVISNCVINLSNDKQSAFNEIARVLKPNGKMLISDIVGDMMPLWVRLSRVMKAACAGSVISEKKYVDGLSSAGLDSVEIVARQYYDSNQLAAIVSEAAPNFLQQFKCCGKSVLHSLLTTLAKPIAKNLWSAKISASLPK